VTPNAVSGSAPSARQGRAGGDRDADAGADRHDLLLDDVLASHLAAAGETYQISSTRRWATAIEVAPAESAKCAALPRPTRPITRTFDRHRSPGLDSAHRVRDGAAMAVAATLDNTAGARPSSRHLTDRRPREGACCRLRLGTRSDRPPRAVPPRLPCQRARAEPLAHGGCQWRHPIVQTRGGREPPEVGQNWGVLC
jgi:hypothetical protein